MKGQQAGGALSWKLWEELQTKQATIRYTSSLVGIILTCGTITCF